MTVFQIGGYVLDALSFVIVLGVAVVIHEAGHFIIARLSGIKVERFSVGFGKPLLSYRRGDTEYVLAPIPLGGYVRMAGENPAETTGADYEFYSISPWKRIPTVLAGPLANIVGACLIFFCLAFLFGKPYRDNVIGEVIPGSIAYEVGLKKNDVIQKVNGVPVHDWEEFTNQLDLLTKRGDETLVADIQRATQTIQVTLPISEQLLDRSLVLSYIDPAGPAFDLGLKEGDRMLSIDGKSPETWSEFRNITQKLWEETPAGVAPRTVSLVWKTFSGEIRSASITPVLIKGATGAHVALLGVGQARIGISSKLPPVVHRLIRGFPAIDSGLKPGATIIAVNNEPVDNAIEVERRIAFSYEQSNNGATERIVAKPIELTWKNPGSDELITKQITPRIEYTPDPDSQISVQLGKQFPVAQLGIKFKEPHRTLGLFGSIKESFRQTGVATVETYAVLKGLITGRVSHKLVGGPVAIAQISVRIGRDGFQRLFWLCAVIQVNLALLNLLPIPILDGGHIIVALCEGVARRRFTLKQMEFIQYIGLAILLPLFAFVFLNDFARLGLFTWIKELFF